MKRIFQKGLSPYIPIILHTGFLTILIQLCLITAFLLFGDHQNKLYAFRIYHGMLEYILLDVALVIGGAFLFELAERDATRNQ